MKIISVKYLSDYKIEVCYEDNSKYIFDLETSIKEFVNEYDRFHELLEKEYFKSVRLNDEWNTVEWDNGFDISPELMQPAYAIK